MRYTIIKTQMTSMMTDSMFMIASSQLLASVNVGERKREKQNGQKNENKIFHNEPFKSLTAGRPLRRENPPNFISFHNLQSRQFPHTNI